MKRRGPSGSVPPTQAAVVMAVLAGARSINEVAMAIGRDRATVYGAMCRARRAGLITWEPRLGRTLRPTLAVAASDIGRRS